MPKPDKNKNKSTPTPAIVDKGNKNLLSVTKKYPICEKTIKKIASPFNSLDKEFGRTSFVFLIFIEIKIAIKKITEKIIVEKTALFTKISINYVCPQRITFSRWVKQII